jgi:hypothetical protein
MGSARRWAATCPAILVVGAVAIRSEATDSRPAPAVGWRSARDLADSCVRALLESAVPRQSIRAYHGCNDRLERVFYFYFRAPPPDLMGRVLVEFCGSPCPQLDLEHFTEIRFP